MATPHKHAAIIKQWADDPSQPVWFWDGVEWKRCVSKYPTWRSDLGYAIGDMPSRPPRKMCVLAGVEFPMPETVAPAMGDSIYVPDPRDVGAPYYTWPWDGTDGDEVYLEIGFVHLTPEAAKAHARALQAATRQAIEAAQ